MLGTTTKKQFYSNYILKTIKIQYPKNMAQETEETGTKPVLGTQSQKCKKKKKKKKTKKRKKKKEFSTKSQDLKKKKKKN